MGNAFVQAISAMNEGYNYQQKEKLK